MTRSISKTILSGILAALMVCIAMPILAKVTVEQASKLNKELTPAGGERAGNKEGTIPAWTGGLTKTPQNINFNFASGQRHPDPFAEDKILFTITAKNVDQYKDKLTPGLLEMFKRYPETWKMNIYPTRRSAAFSDEINKGTYDNALTAEVVDRDGSMTNYYKGYPFPIPANGTEAILNFLNRPFGVKNLTIHTNACIVQADGHRTDTLCDNWYFFLAEGVPKEKFNPKDFTNCALYEFLTPPGRKGEFFLRVFRGDYREEDAGGWSYMPGQRRVRRAPNIFYDGMDPAHGGVMVNDDSFMFSSKIDRFDWSMAKEKKEMFVPYNCYRIDLEPTVDPIMTPKHPNPEFIRWELHRVWETVSTLSKGYRHQYGKRVFYQDEDTWQILLKDTYDTRGSLWRMAFACGKQYYDVPAYRQTSFHNFDFQVETYYSASMTNGLPAESNEEIPLSNFTIQYLRKVGTR